jgi:hypothetical protein
MISHQDLIRTFPSLYERCSDTRTSYCFIHLNLNTPK